MLEVYQAYSDCAGMMQLTEELVTTLAKDVLGRPQSNINGKEIDLTKWERISFAKLMLEQFDIHPNDEPGTWIAN